jgi:Bacterial mobilisation protein (MobC)
MSRSIVRTKIMQIRVSDLEFEMIHSRASQAGLTCSELFRRNALLRPLPKRVTKIAIDTYIELGRIGNNINQLAASANAAIKLGQKPPYSCGELEALREILHQIRREITLSDESLLEDEDDLEDFDEQ